MSSTEEVLLKSILLLALILLGPQTQVQATPGSTPLSVFEGDYTLVAHREEGRAFCYDAIRIVQEKGLANLYVDQNMSYGPAYSAEINGPSRKETGNHDQGMSRSSGQDKVTLEKGVLSFQYKGVEKVLGVPVTLETDRLSFRWSPQSKSLVASREVSVNLVKIDRANCVYQGVFP